MPYTYMALILSELPDEEAYAYMVDVTASEEGDPDLEMFVGEVYKLPLTGTGHVKWESSDAEILSINEKGMMTGKAAGDAVVTLYAPDEKHSSFKVRVLDA